ncbi:hypothetical protein ABVT39_016285 [Epinephelus coioides]
MPDEHNCQGEDLQHFNDFKIVNVFTPKHNDFEPFIVALFYGVSKPNSVDDFLGDFLAEYTELQKSHITVNGKEIHVCIKAFVCDSPVRAFLKYIKGHTGYHCCERCTIKGEYKNKRVVFLGDYPLRTDRDFSNGFYVDHQMTSKTVRTAISQAVQRLKKVQPKRKEEEKPNQQKTFNRYSFYFIINQAILICFKSSCSCISCIRPYDFRDQEIADGIDQ